MARFSGKIKLKIKVEFSFSLHFPITFQSLRTIHRDIIINLHRPSCKKTHYSFHDLGFFRQNLQQSSNTKFHEYISSEGRVATLGRTDKRKILIDAF
jgi:hypothetical protein